MRRVPGTEVLCGKGRDREGKKGDEEREGKMKRRESICTRAYGMVISNAGK
jgi:hypothetical protein